MQVLIELWESLPALLPFLIVTSLCAGGLWLAHWLLLRRNLNLGQERQVPRQLVMLVLTAVAVVLLLLALPVSEATRGQLLSLLGVLLTAVIALSSTTFVANVMAGLMLRLVRNFRSGDFVRVGDHFGRVTERGLLHTEIQTEARDLTTLPNLYLITNPTTVVRASGTIVTCELSLGYDVSHDVVRPLLIEAAERAGLTDPFVRVIELGDNAVTYRVCGFLDDVKLLLGKRSEIRMRVLDTLHEAEIEIASPSLRIIRQVEKQDVFVPDEVSSQADTSIADDRAVGLVFDKAERAETIESLRERRLVLEKQIEELNKERKSASEEVKKSIDLEINSRRKRIESIDTSIAQMENLKD